MQKYKNKKYIGTCAKKKYGDNKNGKGWFWQWNKKNFSGKIYFWNNEEKL